MHTLTTRVRLELPHLTSVRRRVLAAGASVAVSDADAERLRGLFGLRAMFKRGDVTLVPGKPDDLTMRVVRVDGQDVGAAAATLDRVEHAVQVARRVEAMVASFSDDERERFGRLMGGFDDAPEGESEPAGAADPAPALDELEHARPPSPVDPPADPVDPWNLAGRDREGLRTLARELGLADKVDLRIGEDRLREALGAAIAASLGAEG